MNMANENELAEEVSSIVQHEIGNSVFAIETTLSSLRRRCPEQGDILDGIQGSLERIKDSIHKVAELAAGNVDLTASRSCP